MCAPGTRLLFSVSVFCPQFMQPLYFPETCFFFFAAFFLFGITSSEKFLHAYWVYYHQFQMIFICYSSCSSCTIICGYWMVGVLVYDLVISLFSELLFLFKSSSVSFAKCNIISDSSWTGTSLATICLI